MEADSSLVSGVESFSTLWAGKEISARPLLLPDSMRPKFYLPDVIGKKRRKQKALERDRQRLEFFCLRDSQHQYGGSSTRFAASKLLSESNTGTKLENDIMKKLLEPYMQDESSAAALISRAREILSRRVLTQHRKQRHETQSDEEGDQEKDIFDDTNVVPTEDRPETSFDLLSPRPPSSSFGRSSSSMSAAGPRYGRQLSVSEKGAIALNRKKELEAAFAEELGRKHSVLEERLNSAFRRMQSQKRDDNPSVMWTGVVLTIKFINIFSAIVNGCRITKAQDQTRWRAAILIQRLFRKSNKIDTMATASIALLKDEKAKECAKRILAQRQENLTIIKCFLSALKGGLRSAVASYLRKIKLLQRRFRIHRLYNEWRLGMLEILYDKCFSAIQYQVNTFILKRISANMANGVGTVGSEKWREIFAVGAHNRILEGVMSRDILRYMKNELLDPSKKELKRAFFSAVIPVDPYWRRAALYDLLLKCRWEEIRSAALKVQKMTLYDHIPMITDQDARAFVREGIDVLSNYILSYDNILNVTDHQKDSSTKKTTLKYNIFLSHVAAGDMVDIIFESILNSIHYPGGRVKTSSTRSSRQSKVALLENSGPRRSSSLVHRPNSSNSRSYFNSRGSGYINEDNNSDCGSVYSIGSVNSRKSFMSLSPEKGRRRSHASRRPSSTSNKR